MSTTLTINFQ